MLVEADRSVGPGGGRCQNVADAWEAIPLAALGRPRGAIEDLPTLFTVDLVDLGSVDPAFRRRVIARGIRL